MWEDGIWSFWQGLGFADIHDPLTGLLALDLHSATYFQPPKTLVSYPTRVHFRVGHLSTHSCSKSPKPVKIAYPCFYVYHLNRPSSFIPLSPSDTPYAPTTLNSKQHFPPTPPPTTENPHMHTMFWPLEIFLQLTMPTSYCDYQESGFMCGVSVVITGKYQDYLYFSQRWPVCL